jgi:hypothetical protein
MIHLLTKYSVCLYLSEIIKIIISCPIRRGTKPVLFGALLNRGDATDE